MTEATSPVSYRHCTTTWVILVIRLITTS